MAVGREESSDRQDLTETSEHTMETPSVSMQEGMRSVPREDFRGDFSKDSRRRRAGPLFLS